jgi:hypothetical protein
MSVLRAKTTLRKQMNLAWSELTSSIGRMAADCEVRPHSHAEVFDIDSEDDQSMKVVVRPVAFRLKEKAADDRAEMFVTVFGKVNFSIDAGMDPPRACYFNSQVGYFRLAGSGSKKIDHVLGIHYDYDDRTPGHPVFHAQLTSCQDHLEFINARYHPQLELRDDLMTHVARKVRLPTAHMDPLAVFVQLLADHLLNENSGSIESAAFERARTALMFFCSDPAKSRRLEEVRGNNCFRGPRWYPISQAHGSAQPSAT